MRLIGTAMITAGMGLAALGAAGPASAQPADGAGAVTICHYQVTARDGVHVRAEPQGRILGTLPHGKKFTGDCMTTRNYVHVRGGVPTEFKNKWVYARYVKKIPGGGVDTGAGGTSAGPDYLMAGAGLGAIALGGGLVLTTRRRRVSADN